MKLVYLHGFNSAADLNSDKVTQLQSAGYEVQCVSYDSFGCYADIISSIVSQVEDMYDVSFIGTSLGAYYASAIASEYSRPSILINPCLNPALFFNKIIGKSYVNYKTGEIREVKSNRVATYLHTVHDFVNSSKFKPLVLLDEGDELFDSYVAVAAIDTYQTHVFKSGNHRFTHMKQSIPYINDYLYRCESLLEVSN